MSKPILLLNCGSSSVKYQVIDAESEAVTATGLIQRIGEDLGTIDHTHDGNKHSDQRVYPDHKVALAHMVAMFEQYGPSLNEVVAVGHRCVHGGERFRETTVIDDAVIAALRELIPLAPLHNPPGIAGIDAARAELPDVPHVAVFDTAFFSTLPAQAYSYAIDTDLAKRYGIRKYGFHGTSHSYVSRKAAEFLGKDMASFNQIVAHLGNGASISAIQAGAAVDTSMGLTPLAGLVMGTRSGDVDPGLTPFLANQAGMSIAEIDDFLNKKSGLIGLSGVNDFRDLEPMMDAGDERALLAMDVYVHRLISYIGSYLALLGHVEALTFTAGVGENQVMVRERTIRALEPFGFVLDPEANNARSKQARRISTPDSPVAVLVIPTNEELAMARETVAAIN
ncbi:MAG: acetate kinase [Propionibacteriaceae bacterium]|nr:acetate kinase [Propionibacteriaceae bacterium]